MKEGEPVLGGPQVSPGNVQPTNPGVQPVGFETLQNTQTAQATPLVSTPSPTFAPSTPPVGTQLNNPAPLQPAPTSPQIPPQPLRQFSPQSTTSPAAPNMGDIILSDTPPQKSKKGLVIALVLATLVLVGVGVGVMLLSKKNTANEIAKSKDTFNVYANYLLFGDSVDNAIDVGLNDTEGAIYALDCKNKTQIECKEFFEEAKKLLDNFGNSNYKEGLSEEDTLEVENYFSIFDEYYNYIVFGEMNDDAILALYVENGYDGSIKYVEKYYSDLVNSDDTFLVNYGNYGIAKTKILIDNIRELDQAGCIVDGQNDQECMEDFRYSEDTIERIMNFEYGISNNMHISINDARNNLVYETISIANLLSGNGDDDGKEK